MTLDGIDAARRTTRSPYCSAEERAELELAHMRARLLGALVSMAVARPRKPVVLSVETTTRGVWPLRGRR